LYDIVLLTPPSPFLIHDAVFPPLGIMYLSSALKKAGYSVKCLDLGRTDQFEYDSNVYGLSFTSPQSPEAWKLISSLKALGKTVIVGGPHPTHCPQECLVKGADYVIRGEGELSLVALMNGIVNNYGSERIIDGSELVLDDSPDREALPIRDYPYYIMEKTLKTYRLATTMMTTRGCPYSCAFCAKIAKNFRMNSADGVIDEISIINEKYGYNAIMIFDDIFVVNRQRLRAIANDMGKKDIIFRCFLRANLVDEEVCHLLTKMGVVEVGMGIESGSDKLLSKSMKGTSVRMNTTAVQLLKKAGIRVKAFLMVGLPGEDEESFRETESWIQWNEPDDIDVSVLQLMPGSKMYNSPESYGLTVYSRETFWYKGSPNSYHVNIGTEKLSGERIAEMRLYLEENYKKKELLR
jgi:anaerobic magnesium-protoporphyrin IX monomethyl ester cyclase